MLTKDGTSSSDGVLREPRMNLCGLSCEYLQGCSIFVLCLLMYYRDCFTSRLNLNPQAAPKEQCSF